jgi:Flp pilus assembly protein TadG
MTVYVILLLVLVTIVMVGSAFLDRRRARQIERDLARMRAEQRDQLRDPHHQAQRPKQQDRRHPRG